MDERLLARVNAGRRPRRAHVVLEAPPVVAGRREVVGERGGDVVERVGVQGLERLARAPVQPRPPGGRQLAVDRLADQRVREAIPADRVGRLDQHALGQGIVHGLEQSLAVEAGDPLERVEVELGPEHGRGGQRGPLELVQAPHPAQQEVLDASGTPASSSASGRRTSSSTKNGLPSARLGHGPQGAGASAIPRSRTSSATASGASPARSRARARRRGAGRRGVGQRIVLAHLGVAVGAEHEQGGVRTRATRWRSSSSAGGSAHCRSSSTRRCGAAARQLREAVRHRVEQR